MASEAQKVEHEQKAFFEQESSLNREILDTANEERLVVKATPGITEDVVRLISADKNEPEWMLQLRLKALEVFQRKPLPTWGPDISKLNLNEITYFAKPDAKESKRWEDVPEDIRRTFERLGIPEAERTVLAGVGSQYDCLTSDSLVYTNPKGPVKIKNIKVGDTAFAWDEKTNKIVVSRVNAVLNKGHRPVFKVKVAGREIKVTMNHPFLALVDKRKEGRKRARYAKEWRYLSDLKEGDVIGIATDIPDCGKSYKFPEIEVKRIVKGRNQFGYVYDLDISKSYNEIKLPKTTDEDLMWLLGLFLGDGYIGYFKEKDKANVKIAIPESQPQLRKELIEVCKKLFDYDLKSLYKDYVCINSTILARFLEKIGFSGNAKTKKIPDWVLTLPKNEKLAFLGGYLDSDGNVRDHKKSKDVVFTSINQNILLKAKQLCTYCGLQTSKITTFSSKHPFDKTREMTGHRLHVSGNTSLLKSRYDFKRDRLFKKKYYAKFSSILETDLSSHCSDSIGFAKIKSIDYAGIEQVYDISVEEYKNFVAEGIIVHNSEMVYHNLKEEWAKQGVIFENMDVALQQYPELVKQYFMKCVPISDHKFAALHGAVWSGGTFIYIPKGVKMRIPLQAYFRMNTKGAGQFEHTLIIVDEDAEVHYIEGCFTKGNLITTNPDYKTIEKIKENEKVLTSEGAFKTTKDMQQMPYSGDLYTIEIYGDSTQKIEVTPEHPFLYVDRKRARDRNKTFVPRWNMPLFFKKKEYLCVPINKEVKTQEFHEFEIEKGKGRHGFEKKKVKVPLTNEFFRLVGYYFAEGSVSSNSYLNFSFNINEKEYVEDVKYCLNKVFGVTKVLEMVYKKNNGVSVVVCSVELARIFKQLGDKCDKKALLPWMMYETKEHQQEILRSWFRGDGNYYNKRSEKSGWLKESLRINTTSEKLVRQMRDVVLRLGAVAFINRRERSHEGRRAMFTLGFTGEHMVKAGELLTIKVEEKIHGKRRASMFGIDQNFAYLPIKKVTRKTVENIPVFNFGVNDHETYTVAGVAAHNCSAPQYTANSLHAGCVEVFVKKGARARYSSVENWSKNTYNLNTKRALVEEEGFMEWIGGNMGSQCTMLYPCSILKGRRARADHISIAFAGKGQNQDTGAKVIHLAPETSSTIKAKSISKDGGTTTYRGLLKMNKGAKDAKSHTVCEALILDKDSISNTTPHMEINEESVDMVHEATTGRISEEKLFYLRSRGLSEEEAMKLVVTGFIEPIIKQLPLEYAVELNRLIELEIEGVG